MLRETWPKVRAARCLPVSARWPGNCSGSGYRRWFGTAGVWKPSTGLRTVFGEARAEVIAAAFMPDEPKETRTPGRQKEHGTGEGPARRPQQGKLL